MVCTSENVINVQFVTVPHVKVSLHGGRLEGSEGQTFMNAGLALPTFFFRRKEGAFILGLYA